LIEPNTIDNPRMSSRTLASTIAKITCISLSHSAVSKIRNLLKFRYQKPHIRQQLTPLQIITRISFCESGMVNEIDWGSEVVISDESRFGLYSDNQRLWIRRGVYSENTFISHPKYELSLMVWSAIGYNYKSPLIFIEGNINADGYIELLQTHGIFDDIKKAFGEKPVYFQQDGAPAHTAKRTKNIIKAQIDIIDNWPPNSCDLSPIEQLSAIIKAKLGIRQSKSL
jgi:hypothetical protein